MGSIFGSGHNHAGDGVKWVDSILDFPPKIGGKITLEFNTEYVFKKSIITDCEFVIPAGSTNSFRAEAFNIQSFTYTGSNICFTGAGVGLFQFFDIAALNTGSGTLFDLTGAGAGLSQVGFFNSRTSGWASMGTLEDARPFFNSSAFVDSGTLTLINANDIRFVESIFINTSDSGNPFIRVQGKNNIKGKISDCTVTTLAGESFLDIRPDIGNGSAIRIVDNSFNGAGPVFTTGTTGSITAFANAAISSTTITSVSDSSGVARFNFTGPTVFVNQEVVLSGYTTNTAYNTTGIISATDGTTFFEISSIAFGTNESGGAFTSASVTVTDAAHGLSETQGLCVKNSLDYDGGATIYNVQTNTFQINRAFVATETGTWDTGSLVITEPRLFGLINTSDLPAQKVNSRVIGSWTAQDNVAVTTIITQGELGYVPFNLGNLVTEGIDIQRFKVIDINTGRMKYIGREPFDGLLTAVTSCASQGAAEEFRFRATINDVNGTVSANEIRNDVTETTLLVPLSLVNGDEIQVEVGNFGGTSNVVCRFITVNIQ